MVRLPKVLEFEWDAGNIDKSYQKHGITPNETEQVFTDEDVQVEKDIKHQEKEERYIAIGKNDQSKNSHEVWSDAGTWRNKKRSFESFN